MSLLPIRILTKCHTLIQGQCLSQIGKARRSLFDFGIQALSLKPIVSLNANARSVITSNRNTAESTMTRLLHNNHLAAEMGQVVKSLDIVKPTSVVSFDHTEHDGVIGFVGAVQTRRGRAVPCFVDTALSGKLPAHDEASPRKKAMRASYNATYQKLTEHTLGDLKQFRDQCGFWPRLVFDRWFAYRQLVELMVGQKATFYVRMKASRFVELYGREVAIRDLDFRDQTIMLYGQRLRLVISHKAKTWKEPWYILTNDFAASHGRVIRLYYHRFEIEESFKDIKHLRGLIKIQVQKALSFKIVLWFMILGILILYLAGRDVLGVRGLLDPKGHPKKQLSWFKQLIELIEQLLWQPVHELFGWRTV